MRDATAAAITIEASENLGGHTNTPARVALPEGATPGGAPGTIRLFRGEVGSFMRSIEGGGWFTTDPDKAAQYAKDGGRMVQMDVPYDKEYMGHFVRTADAPDEYFASKADLMALAEKGLKPVAAEITKEAPAPVPGMPQAPTGNPQDPNRAAAQQKSWRQSKRTSETTQTRRHARQALSINPASRQNIKPGAASYAKRNAAAAPSPPYRSMTPRLRA